MCGLVALVGVPRLRARIAEEAYVWQRAWTPAVATSVAAHGASFGQLDVLAAEIALPGPTAYPKIDWRVLAGTQRPFALVVRLQHVPAGCTPTVIQVAQQVLARAQAAGVPAAELQLDFDCASSRLPDYVQLLAAVRRDVRPPRLTITALPDWLGRPAFAAVAHAVDAFTLQVHSVERPDPARPIALCDPAKALAWIAQANRLARPFRVSLPDYGYQVAFSLDGRYLGLRAEGGAGTWPIGTATKSVMADPAGIASIVRSLQAEPPSHLASLAWFRLPVSDDQLCWPWVTLSAVRDGHATPARFDLRLAPAPDGARDLIITNTGTGPATAARLPLHVVSRQVLAWDLAPGWRTRPDRSGNLWIEADPAAPLPLLQPGESRRIGWLRLLN